MWRTGAGQTIGPNGDSATSWIGSRPRKDDMTAAHDSIDERCWSLSSTSVGRWGSVWSLSASPALRASGSPRKESGS